MRLKNASTCQLELLSRQDFAVIYASNVRPCSTGFTARVTIGANKTPVERHVAFALVARNGGRGFTGRFWVGAAPATTSGMAPSPGPASPLLHVVAEQSSHGPGASISVDAEITGVHAVIYVVISATPPQMAVVGWSNSCVTNSQGGAAVRSGGGQYRLPVKLLLPKPVPSSDCDAGVLVSLGTSDNSGGGGGYLVGKIGFAGPGHGSPDS